MHVRKRKKINKNWPDSFPWLANPFEGKFPAIGLTGHSKGGRVDPDFHILRAATSLLITALVKSQLQEIPH